jgi:hypothetical protein
MDNIFSKATKALIAESREIALDLGYGHISTLHFFLADCKRNSNDSIRYFAFGSDEELLQYYDAQKIGPQIYLDTLPLTIEAEHMIRKAVILRKTTYKDNRVHPWHFFLAGSQLENTEFYFILNHIGDFHKKLDEYYTEKGVINKPVNSWKSFLSGLFK